MKKEFLFTFILSILLANSAFGSYLLNVSTKTVVFTNKGRRSAFLTVTNRGNSIGYIKLTSGLIKNIGTEDEQVIKMRNPRDLGLLASPARMILKPHETKKVRISLLSSLTKNERYYQVHFSGMAAPSGKTVSKGIGLEINAGGGLNVLIIVRPKKPRFRIKIIKENHEIKISNKGNAFVVISHIKECIDNLTCKDMSPVRLFPNETKNRKLLLDGKATVIKYITSSDGKEEKNSLSI